MSTPAREVFVSYSRSDTDFVRRLHDALDSRGRKPWVDWEGIVPTAEWMKEIHGAIEGADSVVFVLSPASLGSKVCLEELEHARQQRKRLIPVVCRGLQSAEVPEVLAALQWISCTPDDDFDEAVDTLFTAMDTDLEWVRAHTRILVRASEWSRSSSEDSLLLRGNDLQEAEKWLAAGADKEPKPTELHSSYVLASRVRESRRQRRTLLSVATALVVSLALAAAAWVQTQEARSQRSEADLQRAEADLQRAEAVQQAENAEARRVEAERQNVVALTSGSQAFLSTGLELEALVAAVKAGRKLQDDPIFPEGALERYRAVIALRRAVFETHERNRIVADHFRGVSQVAYAPNDSVLFMAGGGGAISRWTVQGQHQGRFQTDHNGEGDGCTSIRFLAVSPDNGRLLTVGNEGRTRLWTFDGTPTQRIESGVRGGGYCTSIGAGSVDFGSGVLELESLSGSRQTWTFEPAPNRAGGDAQRFRGEGPVSAADGRHVAVRENTRAGVTTSIRTSAGAEILRLAEQGAPAFRYGVDQVATVSEGVDGRVVRIWDLYPPAPPPPAGQPTAGPATPSQAATLGDETFGLLPNGTFDPDAGVLSPDGTIVAVSVGLYRRITELWRLAGTGGGEPATLLASFDNGQIASADFPEALSDTEFSPDGRLLATGGTDGTVKIWDLEGTPLRTLIVHDQYARTSFSPDGRLLVTSGDGRVGTSTVKLWTVEGVLLDDLDNARTSDAWFGPDGHTVTASGESLRAWTLDLDSLVRAGCGLLADYLAHGDVPEEDRRLCG